MCTDNILNAVVPYLASLFLGLKVASLDPSFSKDDTKHLISLVKPKLIFASLNGHTLLTEVLKESNLESELIIIEEGSNLYGLGSYLEASDEENTFAPFETKDLKETCAIFFSSGTTGLPKGICLNHIGLLSLCQIMT